jgi:hypothetical protein
LKRANISGGQTINSSKGFVKNKDETPEMIEQLRSDNRKLK